MLSAGQLELGRVPACKEYSIPSAILRHTYRQLSMSGLTTWRANQLNTKKQINYQKVSLMYTVDTCSLLACRIPRQKHIFVFLRPCSNIQSYCAFCLTGLNYGRRAGWYMPLDIGAAMGSQVPHFPQWERENLFGLNLWGVVCKMHRLRVRIFCVGEERVRGG